MRSFWISGLFVAYRETDLRRLEKLLLFFYAWEHEAAIREFWTSYFFRPFRHSFYNGGAPAD